MSRLRRIYHQDGYDTSHAVGSFWESDVPDPKDADPVLEGDHSCEVAIIGAGYTGLSCALHLARDHGIEPVVVDAARVGWGASGRNAGFCGLGGSKLSDARFAKRHGEHDLQRFYSAQIAAVDLVASLLDEHNIDAQSQHGGEFLLAHRPKDFDGFDDDAVHLAPLIGKSCAVLKAGDLREAGLHGPNFYGALHLPVGFGLHPRRYVFGLAEAARTAGTRIFSESPVARLSRRNDGRFDLQTPKGRLVADRIVTAANGYNSENVPTWMGGRYLPVVSHIMVTDPIAPEVLAAQGFHQTVICCDTRTMLHYFRLLPDRRMLFGMRGTANLDPKSVAGMPGKIRADFDAMFPGFAGVPTAFHWSGLICVSRNLVPYVGPIPDWKGAFASLAYHGGGVGMASYCGRQVAGMVAGREYNEPLPDAMRQPLAKYPFANVRRLGLPAAFKWYGLRDR